MVTFQPITNANREAVHALRVAPHQQRFVSDVARSLEEAAEHPGTHPTQWAICDGETPVGFVMYCDEVDGEDYIPQFLWKLLIDEHHQRKGYGTAALDLVVEYFRSRPGIEVLWTSAVPGEGSPIPFYERYGFVRAGDHEGEVLLKLRIHDRSR
jgi:diamine N-acetyltransferase